ncbi:MAG: hypothetical protein KAR36_10260 [Candidatus Latescibacteria bacterium]|nr:hypothetical protein [Candidatus Latescibacterota bacterium]
MRSDKLTEKSQEVVQEAQRIAQERSHSEIGAEHLLMALLERGFSERETVMVDAQGKELVFRKGDVS